MIFPQFKKDIIQKYLFEVISNRKIIFLSAVAILPILFNKYFESILNEYIGKPIFQNLESSYFSDIIFLVISILLFFYYRYKYKNDHYFSSFDSSLVIVIGFWYFIYRCSGGWHYSRFWFMPILSYLDIFLIVPLAHIFFCIKRCTLQKQAENQEDTKKGFQTDKPIEELSDEKLGRGNYAQKIAEQINDSFPKESFAIGITGKWGSGKTSFLHLIKKKLNGNTIIVDFNAWHSHETKNLITDFFDLLKAELNDGSVSQHINLYVKQLTAVDDNIYFKTIDFLQKTIFGTQSTQEIFDRINASIKRLNKQIVIFIDDLDRLDNKEIIEIIKLIRISANFKNTVFVVAFDKGYVINAIAEINPHEKERFLEKIFQAEFPLPTFEKNRFRSIMIEKLKSKLNNNYHIEIDKYFSDISHLEIFERCIHTLRDVTIFTNPFCINFEQVAEDVLFADFFNVELIKLKYHTIYTVLFEENKYFLSIYKSNVLSNNNSKLNFLYLDETKFKEYLKSNASKLKITTDNIEEINSLVSKIFFQPKKTPLTFYFENDELINTENIQSIRRPSNFYIYSSMRLTEGVLSERDFKNVRKSENINDFKIAIKNWIDKNLIDELILKFEITNLYDSLEDFELIIKGMLELGQHLFLLEKFDRFHLYQVLRNKLQNNFKNIVEFYQNDELTAKHEYNKIILRIFEDDEYNSIFKAEFLHVVMKAEGQSYNFPIDEQNILDLLFYFFNDFCNANFVFNKELWDLYKLCIFVNEHGRDFCDERVNELVKSFALEHDIIGFFEKNIVKYNGKYRFGGFINELFQTTDQLKSFINKVTDPILKTTLLTFYEKSEKNKFILIDFDFSGIIIPVSLVL
ncbi:P-loop NTPase fold protein [Arcicella rosea]|uniref:Putative KAP-like P-loop ATPase n=1 Tax=Arcicella rosea TaxID=502909 RepID=A0A841EQS7_9BACT|nr:P-loop NTPase fold protein [Arcicella rosea]MBB6005286.1 putative KAP-like P-loop ATPase [Arcicella rosea]